MQIRVDRPQHRRIRILLPNGLLMNRLTAFLIARAQKKSAKEAKGSPEEPVLTARQLYALFREIKRLKKALPTPEWNLVEVEGADGETVILRF